jgi:hypothetical protein
MRSIKTVAEIVNDLRHLSNLDYCDVFDYTDEVYKDSHAFGKVIVQICGE